MRRFALGLERGERIFQIIRFHQMAGQSHAILERAVHALAVERHHRMRSVTDQHGAALLMPAVEGERAEQARRVLFPVHAQVRDQRQRVGELACKQGLGLRTGIDRGEAGIAWLGRNRVTVKVPRDWATRCTCSGRAARCAAHCARCGSRHRQPAGSPVPCTNGQEGDVLAQRRTTVHRRAQCRARAVGADQGVKADVVRAVVTVIDETRVAASKSTVCRRRWKCTVAPACSASSSSVVFRSLRWIDQITSLSSRP